MWAGLFFFFCFFLVIIWVGNGNLGTFSGGVICYLFFWFFFFLSLELGSAEGIKDISCVMMTLSISILAALFLGSLSCEISH